MVTLTLQFRKISARDTLFINIKGIHKDDYTYFLKYADRLTKKSGRAKNNNSNKGRSYANYLIRLVILYQEYFDKKINNLLTFTTLKELEKVVLSEGFQKYNDNENRFPNATFNCYISCVTHLNAKTEDIVDLQFNENLEAADDNEENINPVIEVAQKRKEKIKYGDILTYPRNKVESLEAKRRSDWKCELNPNHITFISSANNKPYIEAHHLIPMSAQDYFETNIDYAHNIVCLCPNCHRKIHHAIDSERREMLRLLFRKREENYHEDNIDINYTKLLHFYEIF